MNEPRIVDKISKVLLGEASAEEVQEVLDWRASKQSNEEEYQQYAEIWSSAELYVPTDFVPNVDRAYQAHLDLLESDQSPQSASVSNQKLGGLEESRQEPSGRKSIATVKRLNWIRAVAAIFVISLAATILMRNSGSGSTSINGADGVTIATLADGSTIWLDEGSKLEYQSGFGSSHRNVRLTGKAHFDVERNEALPFIIDAQEIEVAVLGTSFTVDLSSKMPTVTVSEGTVRVDARDSSAEVTKDQKTVYDGSRLMIEQAKPTDFRWRNERLSFENEDIDIVIRDINMYYGDIIMFDNQVNGDCKFTASALAEISVSQLISTLESNFDLQVTALDSGRYQMILKSCE